MLSFARVHNRLETDPILFLFLFLFFGLFYTVLFEFGKKLDIVATPQHIFGILYLQNMQKKIIINISNFTLNFFFF